MQFFSLPRHHRQLPWLLKVVIKLSFKLLYALPKFHSSVLVIALFLLHQQGTWSARSFWARRTLLSIRERSCAGEKQAALRCAAHCSVPPALGQSSVAQHCKGRKQCKGNTAAKLWGKWGCVRRGCRASAWEVARSCLRERGNGVWYWTKHLMA